MGLQAIGSHSNIILECSSLTNRYYVGLALLVYHFFFFFDNSCIMFGFFFFLPVTANIFRFPNLNSKLPSKHKNKILCKKINSTFFEILILF